MRSSFDSLDIWLEEVRKYSTNQEAVRMLVANKVDKVRGREGGRESV